MLSVFLAFVAVFISLLLILFVTVHRKVNFLVNVYWDNKDSDSQDHLMTRDKLVTTRSINTEERNQIRNRNRHISISTL